MLKQHTKWRAVLLATVALAGVIGCGGSSSSDNGGTAPPNITRTTEATFSESARILAAREAAASGATWLNADTARGFDADLSAVRRTFPQVGDITALSEYGLRTVVVAVRAGTAWEDNWRRGEPTTGEPALDALLAEFAPEQIRALGGAIETMPAYFTVRFGQSLNMVKLAERLKAASANITAANPDYAAGDGNNIVRVANTPGDGSRRYVFSRGSGDCPAGCIDRYSYAFAVSANGETVTLLREYDRRDE